MSRQQARQPRERRNRLVAIVRPAVPLMSRARIRSSVRTVKAWIDRRRPQARAERHLRRALECRESGNFETAVDHYRSAIRLMPTDAHAWAGLASTYNRAFDRENALAAYQRAIDLAPDEPAWHAGIGRVFAAQRNDDSAITHLNFAAQRRELAGPERLALIEAQLRVASPRDARQSILETPLPLEESSVGCELFATGLAVLLAEGSDDEVSRWAHGGPRGAGQAHNFVTSMFRHLVRACLVDRLISLLAQEEALRQAHPLIDTSLVRLCELHEMRTRCLGSNYDLTYPKNSSQHGLRNSTRFQRLDEPAHNLPDNER